MFVRFNGFGLVWFLTFQKMQGPLRSPTTGKVAARDIVQFVPFNAMAGDQDRLSSEVLAEIPDQVVAYFKSRGLAPRAPPPPVPYAPVAAAGAMI